MILGIPEKRGSLVVPETLSLRKLDITEFNLVISQSLPIYNIMM